MTGMSSIGGMMSPREMMQTQLSSAVSAGKINSTDKAALSSALTDIDSAMRSSGPPAGGVSADAMKSKVNGLIDQQVKTGKLTSDQADQLKGLFQDFADKMSAAGGPPGMGGMQGGSLGGTDDQTQTLLDSLFGNARNDDADDKSSTGKSADINNLLDQMRSILANSGLYNAEGGNGGNSETSFLVDGRA
jgi:hypothetical protein